MPELAKLAKENEGRAHVVLVRWWGKPAAAWKVLNEAGVPTWAAAEGQETLELFDDLKASPTTFIGNADGVLVKKMVGKRSHDFLAAQLEAARATK